MLAVSLMWWPWYTRLVYGLTVALRNEYFVTAAEVTGASTAHILFREILPNTLSPILTKMSIDVAWVIIIGSMLSFVGLGVQPPEPSLGTMICDGARYLPDQWWIAAFPGPGHRRRRPGLQPDGRRHARHARRRGGLRCDRDTPSARHQGPAASTSRCTAASSRCWMASTSRCSEGEKVGLVGETGCGKTTTMKAILRVLPSPPARIPEGEILLQGPGHPEDERSEDLRHVRGRGISMIFQDPTAALNPVFTIGEQMEAVIQLLDR